MAVARNAHDGVDNRAQAEPSTTHEEDERYRRLLAENEELKRQIAEREERVGELTHRLHVRTQQRLLATTSSAADGVVQQQTRVDGSASAALVAAT